MVPYTPERIELVIKPIGRDRITASALTREFIGAWMAKELGLHVFEPVLIEVKEEFVSSIVNPEWKSIFQVALGLNFGTIYLSPCSPILLDTILFGEKLNQSAHIFAFDSLISNSDRRVGNDNVLIYNENLYIFDHELAFSYLFVLFGLSVEPWRLTDSDRDMLRGHVFFRRFQQGIATFNEQIDTFSVFNSEFWQKVRSTLPVCCDLGSVDQIQGRTNSILLNIETFKEEINNLFA